MSQEFPAASLNITELLEQICLKCRLTGHMAHALSSVTIRWDSPGAMLLLLVILLHCNLYQFEDTNACIDCAVLISLLVKKHDFDCNVQFQDWAPVCSHWWIKLKQKIYTIILYDISLYDSLSVYGAQNGIKNL